MVSIPKNIERGLAAHYQEFVSKCVEQPSFEQIKTAYAAYDSLQNSIPFSVSLFSWMPFTVSREFSQNVNNVWERFYITCLNSIRNREPSSSIALAIHELEFINTRFPDRDTLLVDLGDRYAQILAMEKAERCYRRAFYLNPTVELAQKLERFYRVQGDADKAKEMYKKIKSSWGRSEAAYLKIAILDGVYGDWWGANQCIFRKFQEKPSLEHVLAFADVLLSLSDVVDRKHIYLSFRDLAQFRVTLLETPSLEEQSRAILDLADYLCCRSKHSDVLISYLINGENYGFELARGVFFAKMEERAQWVERSLNEVERERERLCALLRESSFSCEEEHLEMTSRVRGLHALFQEGSEKIPVGFLHYLSQYKRWLEFERGACFAQEEENFSASWTQQAARFQSLETRAKDLFSSLIKTGENQLATLLERRVSQVASQDTREELPDRAFAKQNLFNYIKLEVVPKERRKNVTEYLKENGIELDDFFSSPFLDYVEQGKISTDYTKLVEFRLENQLKEIGDLRKFVYTYRR